MGHPLLNKESIPSSLSVISITVCDLDMMTPAKSGDDKERAIISVLSCTLSSRMLTLKQETDCPEAKGKVFRRPK